MSTIIPATDHAKRGDTITATGGVRGRYVGERHGVTWVAWEGEDFATVCCAFDARATKKARRR